ncbi:MAG: hypothetical protein sL5_09710 [Candidatus Mesenet longicola]|uniref:Uncharacterized protein n=1 Tax=Candidatus Mesenet longicola TaxID=1892558 RepID=A0A8J3HTH9_9RICK|nr:MAG: hypothetical protein sGL2_10530 [Candidatus Mesenet longicola]GHM59978.1 MAG: hypothetical protein sL5_09710 [Candidatus Mesenet longicola]
MPNQSSKGQRVAQVCTGVLLAAVAAAATTGVALFDRSRSINDPMVIAGGVFFALGTLVTLATIAFAATAITGFATIDDDPSPLRTKLNNSRHTTYQPQRDITYNY